MPLPFAMSRWLGALGVALVCLAAQAGEGLLLQSQHQLSRRYAILEDDGRMAFLYLTERGERMPVRDAVVYTRVPLAKAQDWARVKRGAPPELSLDIASPSAVVPLPRASEFSFRWSPDGESVAILRKGSPVAMASMRHKIGHSKAVYVPSPLAHPWDARAFTTLFNR
jgi:hypothetical protein